MSDWTQHLSDDEIKAVRDAFIALKLCNDRMLSTILSGVDDQYAGSLPTGPTPNANLMIHLSQMNRVPNLRNGVVPLAQYLQAAIDVAGNLPQLNVLESALDRVRASGGAPAMMAAPVAATGPINTEVDLEVATTGVDATLPVKYLQQALATTKSVFRVLVHRHKDGQPEYKDGDQPLLAHGTGWMIGPGIVITNHHVINARSKGYLSEPDATAEDFQLQAEHTSINFDYLEKDSPSFTAVTGPGALLASDPVLDFAILRLPAGAPVRPVVKLRKHYVRKGPEQRLGFCVNVLQHPNGDPMRLGFRENYVVLGDETRLSYLTDTDVGSSGSPVTDDSWMVAALHAGSQPISDQNITVRGRLIRRENYGIPMTAIMRKLEQSFPDVFQEISVGQATA